MPSRWCAECVRSHFGHCDADIFGESRTPRGLMEWWKELAERTQQLYGQITEKEAEKLNVVSQIVQMLNAAFPPAAPAGLVFEDFNPGIADNNHATNLAADPAPTGPQVAPLVNASFFFSFFLEGGEGHGSVGPCPAGC